MKTLKPCHKPLLFFFFLFCGYCVKAQHADSVTYNRDSVYWWGGAHIGGGTVFVNDGLDLSVLWKNKYVLELRGDWGDNRLVDYGGNITTYTTSETALLFGRKLTHQRFSNLFVFTGISAVSLDLRGNYTGRDTYGDDLYGPDIRFSGVGLPLILRYLLAPDDFFAMDFSAAVNVNAQQTFFSITFGMSFGQVRSKDNRKQGEPHQRRPPPHPLFGF